MTIAKIIRGSACMKLLYLNKALLNNMEWDLRKKSFKQINYSAKRSDFQQHLLSILLELKKRMNFELFVTKLTQLYKSCKNLHNILV